MSTTDRDAELAKLKRVIAELLGVEPDEITPQSRFEQDLGADSLDKTELVMAIEEEWGLSIADEDADKIRNVQDALDYIIENAE